jgi:hypothetical protein
LVLKLANILKIVDVSFMPVAITEAITTLAVAEQQLSLTRVEQDDFFLEWQVDLPSVLTDERTLLAEMRQRYLYQRSHSHLLEGTVLLLLASPLLAIAGFYDPPFQVRAEESVSLQLIDSEETLQGRIDALVLIEQLWVVVLESKKTALSVWTALPQTLAYLRANPQNNHPSFGLMTNGDEIVFVKVSAGFYSVSRVFSPLVAEAELTAVLQVLKGLSHLATA